MNERDNHYSKKKNKKIIILMFLVFLIIGCIITKVLINNKEKVIIEEKQELKKLPLPEVTGGERGQLGIDKNINESNIDEYLNRPDSVYRDMRMLEDPAKYENIGGDRFLSGYIKGFEIIPLPYLIPVTGLPEEVGETYSGKTLFDINQEGKFIPNYEESMSIIEELFPKDKVIFLMCGGGGYAGMTKAFLVSLGWDETKIYNIGGYWYYEGKNSIIVNKSESGLNFDTVPYHDIVFEKLTPILKQETSSIENTIENNNAEKQNIENELNNNQNTTNSKIYLDEKYYHNYSGDGIPKFDLLEFDGDLRRTMGTPEYEEVEKKVNERALEYANHVSQMIKNKESFILSVFPTDICYATTSDSKTPVSYISNLSIKYNFYYYKMGLISYKKTELYNKIKYTPTVIIINKGKVIDYIDAEKNEHLKYYDSSDEFEKWLLSYVEMK